MNGIPAPIFAVANISGQEQIFFQVPWEVQGLVAAYTIPDVSIVVVNNGTPSPALRAFFNDLQPAIITSNGTKALVTTQ